MEKGRSANITGNQLEVTVQTVLLNKGFEIEMYREWEKKPEKYGKELLLKNVPFKTIYNHKGNTEFLLISERYNLR
ncbi:MAG TPA: 4-diphosphocytidyl-2C-methyl-D-erythritol kinase, partial [Ignavibacteria bacterium]|nr:4-diphosphocytidyl-2C-methyl-D-erythritol kinase [Ignavibacteria bacterium]